MPQTITIIRPDDWHLHLRDGEQMAAVVGHTAREFARAIIMPNLKPPVTTVELAQAYRERILAALPAGCDFQPLMTLYLTDHTLPTEIAKASTSGFVKAIKLYPAGATTHSESGVTSFDRIMPTLEKMAEVGLPLLIHGEVTDKDVDVFDRESVFIDTILEPLLKRLPELKVVMEHITTTQAADFVLSASANVAATVTAHHLLLNRNALFQGGIRPHHYCLPVLKRETHRHKLVEVVTSGSPKFFLGTDSAPHAQQAKENACGCAGMYTAHAAMPLYAEVFDAVGALDKLEAFSSLNGPAFYGLPVNTGTMKLVKESWHVPGEFAYGSHKLVPLRAGETIHWKLA